MESETFYLAYNELLPWIFAVIFTHYLLIHLFVHSLAKGLTGPRHYGQHINIIQTCAKSLSTLI